MRRSSLLKKLIICFIVIVALTATGCGRGGTGNDSGSYSSGNMSDNESTSSNDGNNSDGDSGSIIPGDETDTTYNGSISLEWDPPVDNVDGSPLNDLAGYKIYYGSSSGNYTQSENVGNTNNTTIENLSSGSWCFAATAYNAAGNESDYSDQFCTDIL